MQKLILITSLLFTCSLAYGQGNYEYTYWIDGNVANHAQITSDNKIENLQIDASDLDNGLHTLHIQVRDKDGIAAPPIKRIFLKARAPEVGASVCFQIDNNKEIVETSDVQEVYSIDASHLNEGLHTVRCMLRSSEGHIVSSALRNFYKVEPDADYINYTCYVDGIAHKQEKVESEQALIEWDIDMTNVERGLHNIEVQAVTPNGTVSTLYKSLFLRVPTDAELNSLDCYCIIDSTHTSIVKGAKEENGYNFEIDASDLEDGEHTMTYLLLDYTGIVTDARTTTFMKKSSANSISFIDTDYKKTIIYDLSGRSVDRITTSGIYIINGKKVLIRKPND